MINISMYLYLSFESGKPLKQREDENERYIIAGGVSNKHRNSTIMMISPLLSKVCILIGGQSESEHHTNHNKLNWAKAQKLILAVIFGDCEEEAVRLGRVFQEYPF